MSWTKGPAFARAQHGQGGLPNATHPAAMMNVRLGLNSVVVLPIMNGRYWILAAEHFDGFERLICDSKLKCFRSRPVRSRDADSNPPHHQINLYPCIPRQSGDADAGPRRLPGLLEVFGIDPVHRLVVLLETGQIDPRHGDLGEVQVQARQDLAQVLHGLSGPGRDAGGQGGLRRRGVDRQLAGCEDPAVGLGGVSLGRHRKGRGADPVEMQLRHRVSSLS